jgi:hypothetical protein
MSFNSYSERTKCPECKARIRLEDVRFTATFSCPICEKEIRVSTLHQKTMKIGSWSLGLLISYTLGRDRLWLVMLFWIVSTAILTFLWAYAGKYLLPPKLEKCIPGPASFHGLGLGPR